MERFKPGEREAAPGELADPDQATPGDFGRGPRRQSGRQHQRARLRYPIVSVDAKKRELVGNSKTPALNGIVNPPR